MRRRGLCTGGKGRPTSLPSRLCIELAVWQQHRRAWPISAKAADGKAMRKSLLQAQVPAKAPARTLYHQQQTTYTHGHGALQTADSSAIYSPTTEPRLHFLALATAASMPSRFRYVACVLGQSWVPEGAVFCWDCGEGTAGQIVPFATEPLRAMETLRQPQRNFIMIS